MAPPKIKIPDAKPRSLFGRIGSALGVMPRTSPMKTMGVGGVSLYGGFVRTFDKSSKWVGQEKYRTAAELATNVSIVAAGVHYFLNMVSHPQWSAKPADEDSDEACKLAEWVEDTLFNMATPWQRVVRRAGLYRFHGFGLQEWTACKVDEGEHAGKIGLKDVESRPQFTIERWEVDDRGEVLGVWQRSPQTGELLAIPRGKLIYLVDDTLSDSPEGLGLFRHMAEPYERIKRYIMLEAMGYERDMRGLPIGRAPLTLINKAVEAGSLSQQEGEALVEELNEFVQNEVKKPDTSLVLDSMPYESVTQGGITVGGNPQWGIELLSGASPGLGDINVAIDRLNREMARIIGVEHLMMGDQGGNRALAEDKSRNLYLIANAVLSNIAFAMERDLLDPLWALNGLPEDLMPTLEVEDVAFKSVQEITAAISQMASAGAVLRPDDPVINDIRDILGVSRAPETTPEMLGAMMAGQGDPNAPEDPPGFGGNPPAGPEGVDGPQGQGQPGEEEEDEEEDKKKKPKGGFPFASKAKKPFEEADEEADTDETELDPDGAEELEDDRVLQLLVDMRRSLAIRIEAMPKEDERAPQAMPREQGGGVPREAGDDGKPPFGGKKPRGKMPGFGKYSEAQARDEAGRWTATGATNRLIQWLKQDHVKVTAGAIALTAALGTVGQEAVVSAVIVERAITQIARYNGWSLGKAARTLAAGIDEMIAERRKEKHDPKGGGVARHLKYSPNQVRDEGGRFAAAGAGQTVTQETASGPGVAANWPGPENWGGREDDAKHSPDLYPDWEHSVDANGRVWLQYVGRRDRTIGNESPLHPSLLTPGTGHRITTFTPRASADGKTQQAGPSLAAMLRGGANYELDPDEFPETDRHRFARGPSMQYLPKTTFEMRARKALRDMVRVGAHREASTLAALLAKFDESQPRDERGRFASGTMGEHITEHGTADWGTGRVPPFSVYRQDPETGQYDPIDQDDDEEALRARHGLQDAPITDWRTLSSWEHAGDEPDAYGHHRPHSKVIVKFDENQPRAEDGKWTSGGGGGTTKDDDDPGSLQHPGEGYSDKAHIGADGKIHTSSVEDAVRALHEDRDVVLDQPMQVSTLLGKLAEVARDMEAKGEKAPNYNLCKVSVRGTSLFCVEGKGLDRLEMPQVKGQPDPGTKADSLPRDERGEVDISSHFRDYLEAHKFEVTDGLVRADHLKATQNELNGVKTAQIAQAFREGKLADERIFVSSDGYILDGHHRWAATVGVDLDDNNPGDLKMKVAVVNAPITSLLKEARGFAAEWGLPQVSMEHQLRPVIGKLIAEFYAKYSPDQERDERGRFAGGGDHGDHHDGGTVTGTSTIYDNPDFPLPRSHDDGSYAYRDPRGSLVTVQRDHGGSPFIAVRHETGNSIDGVYRSPVKVRAALERLGAKFEGWRPHKEMHGSDFSMGRMGKYSPDQPRDAGGRWSGGSEGPGPGRPSGGRTFEGDYLAGGDMPGRGGRTGPFGSHTPSLAPSDFDRVVSGVRGLGGLQAPPPPKETEHKDMPLPNQRADGAAAYDIPGQQWAHVYAREEGGYVLRADKFDDVARDGNEMREKIRRLGGTYIGWETRKLAPYATGYTGYGPASDLTLSQILELLRDARITARVREGLLEALLGRTRKRFGPLVDDYSRAYGVGQYEAALVVAKHVAKYSPDQPRDEDGKWTSGGAAATSAGGMSRATFGLPESARTLHDAGQASMSREAMLGYKQNWGMKQRVTDYLTSSTARRVLTSSLVAGGLTFAGITAVEAGVHQIMDIVADSGMLDAVATYADQAYDMASGAIDQLGGTMARAGEAAQHVHVDEHAHEAAEHAGEHAHGPGIPWGEAALEFVMERMTDTLGLSMFKVKLALSGAVETLIRARRAVAANARQAAGGFYQPTPHARFGIGKDEFAPRDDDDFETRALIVALGRIRQVKIKRYRG